MGQPIAYHITFTTYGSRLHGDDRGTVDDGHNVYGTPLRPADEGLRKHRENLLKHDPVVISPGMRRVIRETLHEVCNARGWRLHSRNIRTNHVHVVLSFGPTSPGKVMGDLKAYATRNLRAAGMAGAGDKLWTAGGSMRPIFDDDGLWRVVDYVENDQGPALPED